MSDEAAATVDVTIRIDKAHADRLDDIVRELEAAGLANCDVHRKVLIVNGAAPAEAMARLRRVDGVASVREDRTYKAGS